MADRRDQYDEQLFLGYVEGDLSPQDAARFEQQMAADPRLGSLVRQIQADRDSLRSLPEEQAPTDLMDRVNARLERQMLLGQPSPAAVISPLAPAREPRRLWVGWAYSGLAAAIALGAVVGWNHWMNGGDGPPIESHHLAMSGTPESPGLGDESGRGDDDALLATKAGGSTPSPALASKAGAIAEQSVDMQAQIADAGTAADPHRDGVFRKQFAGGSVNSKAAPTDSANVLPAAPQLADASTVPDAAKALAGGTPHASKLGQTPVAGGQGFAEPQLAQVTEAAQILEQAKQVDQVQLALLEQQTERLEVGAGNQYARLSPPPRQLAGLLVQDGAVQSTNVVQAEVDAAANVAVAQANAAQTLRSVDKTAEAQAEQLNRQVAQAAEAAANAFEQQQLQEQLAKVQEEARGLTQVSFAGNLAGPRIEVTTQDVAASSADLSKWSRQNKLVCVDYTATGNAAKLQPGYLASGAAGYKRQLTEAGKADTVESFAAKSAHASATGAAAANAAKGTTDRAEAKNARPRADADTLRREHEKALVEDNSRQVQRRQQQPDAPATRVQLVVIPAEQVPQLVAHLNTRAGQRAAFIDEQTEAVDQAFAMQTEGRRQLRGPAASANDALAGDVTQRDDKALDREALGRLAAGDAAKNKAPAATDPVRAKSDPLTTPPSLGQTALKAAPASPTAPAPPAATQPKPLGQQPKTESTRTLAAKKAATVPPDAFSADSVAQQDETEENDILVFGHRGFNSTPMVPLTDTDWGAILEQQLPVSESAVLDAAGEPMTVQVVIQLARPTDADASAAQDPVPAPAKPDAPASKAKVR